MGLQVGLRQSGCAPAAARVRVRRTYRAFFTKLRWSFLGESCVPPPPPAKSQVHYLDRQGGPT